MLEIRIPDWLEFSSKGQALKYGEQAEVSVFLKAEAIFLLFDGSKEKILPQQTELYQFSYLKEKTYIALGKLTEKEERKHLGAGHIPYRYLRSPTDTDAPCRKGNFSRNPPTLKSSVWFPHTVPVLL